MMQITIFEKRYLNFFGFKFYALPDLEFTNTEPQTNLLNLFQSFGIYTIVFNFMQKQTLILQNSRIAQDFAALTLIQAKIRDNYFTNLYGSARYLLN
jgi:hypothetical protein